MATQKRKRGGKVKIKLTAAQRKTLKRIGADVRSINLRFPKSEQRRPKVTCILDRVPITLSGSKPTRRS
jgi:hypothetical protein